MKEKLMKLKQLRELEVKAKEERDIIIEKLPSVVNLQVIKQEREDLEREIRNEALIKYQLTGEKKFGQIGIRITTKYDYDEIEALNWAKNHDLCLSLDKTAFRKQLKVQPLEFVKIEEVPIATLPTEIKEE